MIPQPSFLSRFSLSVSDVSHDAIHELAVRQLNDMETCPGSAPSATSKPRPKVNVGIIEAARIFVYPLVGGGMTINKLIQ